MFEQPNAQQFHISLAGIEPVIWRRLIVPADWTLDQLNLGYRPHSAGQTIISMNS